MQLSLNKKQKRANRLTRLLTHAHNNVETLPLFNRTSVEWLVLPSNDRILNPDSKLGLLLYSNPATLRTIDNYIKGHWRHTDHPSWETVLISMKDSLDCIEREGNTPNRAVKHYNNAVNLIPKLAMNNIGTEDINEIKRAIKRYRKLNPYSPPNHENRNWDNTITKFKESWSSMLPSRVQENFLPNGQAIGVELEWIAPCYRNEDGEYDQREIEFERPRDIYGTSWGYDSSIQDFEDHQYTTGQETRVMLKYGKWNRLIKTCDYIKQRGGEINKSCGLHIHLDTRDISRAATITRGKRLGNAVPWLRLLVPRSRNNSTYCKGTFSARDKYSAVTMSAYGYGRECLEVRLHSGSLNATKIIHWIELLTFIKNNYNHLDTWDKFIESDCPIHLKIWAIKRKEKFNPTVGEEAEETDIESEQIEEIQGNLPPGLPPLPDRC